MCGCTDSGSDGLPEQQPVDADCCTAQLYPDRLGGKTTDIIDEVTIGGYKFGRKKLYIVMVKFIAPVLLAALLLQSLGVFSL